MNFDTKEWAEVVESVTAAVDALKEDLCSTQLTAEQTAYRRGGIYYLRRLLAWPEIEKEAAKAKENPESPVEFGV